MAKKSKVKKFGDMIGQLPYCGNCYKPLGKKEIENNTCFWCGAEVK